MALLEERDRIARDMHDNVIQRLFATGLSLQSATRVAQHPTVRDWLEEAVEELDAAIEDVRHAIFELHTVRHRGGLDNLAKRAEARGGSLSLKPRKPQGAILSWVVSQPVGDTGRRQCREGVAGPGPVSEGLSPRGAGPP